jgi:hypothetical protein
VGLDDMPDDLEPQPDAFGVDLGCAGAAVEVPENPLHLLRRNADALIPDTDLHLVGPFEKVYAELLFAGGVLHRVVDQINHELLDGVPVDIRMDMMGRQVEVDGEGALLKLRSKNLDQVSNNQPDVLCSEIIGLGLLFDLAEI